MVDDAGDPAGAPDGGTADAEAADGGTGPGSVGDAVGTDRVAGTRRGRWLAVYLTGLAMGTADGVPGVSGGTIALVAGVYDRLVAAIAALSPRPALASLSAEEGRARALWASLVGMDVPFLVVLGLGMLTGVATVARVVEFAMEDLPVATFAFFFGVIAASAIVLYGEVSLDSPGRVGAALAGLLGAYWFVGLSESALGTGPATTFLAGVVAISAMILPGVSGSFLLLVLGQYEYMTAALNDFLDAVAALATGGPVSAVVDPGVTVVLFCSGALVGVLTFARLVKRALEADRAVTVTFLVSLMVGALRLPAEEVAATAAGTGDYAAAVVAALVGGALVVGLELATGSVGFE
jgi:putative membrane protein